MSYKINQLAKLSGVSTRTLRYYHEIGLLMPQKVDLNGYRIYTQKEVDILQHILFYKHLGISLKEIKDILLEDNFDTISALKSHLIALEKEKMQIEVLIDNVKKTIETKKEGKSMLDKEKFEGFKDEIIKENEELYGGELRGKYGDEAIDLSNNKIKGMGKIDYEEMMNVTALMNETLKEAFREGQASSNKAQKVCELHEKLLLITWGNGFYSKEKQLNLVESFLLDERFIAYYDKVEKGSVKFLLEATKIYCKG